LRNAAPLHALFLMEPDMSNNAHNHQAQDGEQDTVESIVRHMPIVLPVAGGILMLLLAFIAVFMG
jgi:hypothetical protein